MTGRDGSGAAEGRGSGGGVEANGPGLHQVRAKAILFSILVRAELHQRDRVEVL